ncbi:hypothetical protein GLDPPO_GLDPPO_00205, partial [Dysosmobacter welbionis]
ADIVADAPGLRLRKRGGEEDADEHAGRGSDRRRRAVEVSNDFQRRRGIRLRVRRSEPLEHNGRCSVVRRLIVRSAVIHLLASSLCQSANDSPRRYRDSVAVEYVLAPGKGAVPKQIARRQRVIDAPIGHRAEVCRQSAEVN